MTLVRLMQSWSPWSGAAVALMLVFSACEDDGNVVADAGDAAPPQVDADAEAPDGRTDASDAAAWPDAQVFDFCDEPVFKLPMDSTKEYTMGIDLWRTSIAYTRWPFGENRGDLYLFELDSCLERRLTVGGSVISLEMGKDLIATADGSWWLEDDSYCYELVTYDLVHGTSTRLTETDACESDPVTNGRHVGWQHRLTQHDSASLRLRDLIDGTEVELAVPGYGMSLRLTEQYAVWSAYSEDPLSEGRDVFVRDLAGGVTTHLDETYERRQTWVFAWDDYLTWHGEDVADTPPFHLMLHHLPTGDTTNLLEGDYAMTIAPIRGGLAVWNTSRFTGTQALNPSDIEILDVVTGVRRRVTVAATPLRARRIDPPYLLLVDNTANIFVDDYYVANLEALGIIDASGRVIPGVGVLEMPAAP